MGCLGCMWVLITVMSPRIGLVFLWLLTDFVQRAFATWPLQPWIWMILGILFLPWTTLFFMLVTVPFGAISLWGWLFVLLGLAMDISSYGQAYRDKDQAMGMVGQAKP